MPKSVSYQDHRLEFLKNPEAAAAYIEAILEEKEPESELLQLALRNVAEALGTLNMTPEEVKQHQEMLEKILSYPGGLAIYSLGSWLKSLGLKLTVTLTESAKEQIQNPAPNQTYSQPAVDLATQTTPSTVSR